MAGGIFTTQDKRLPGAWVNVKGVKSNIVAQSGTRGTVFTILSGLDWGADGIVEVTLESDIMSLFGRELADPVLVGLRMILNNAHKVIVYNVNPGTKSAGTNAVLPWDIVAKYNGKLGDAITITVSPDANAANKWSVSTIVGTGVVDTQVITGPKEFTGNGYVSATIKSELGESDALNLLLALTNPVSVKLTGGETKPSSDTTKMVQEAIETNDFETMVAVSSADDSPLHSLLAASATRLRDKQGRKVQAVIPAAAGVNADYEGIIQVGNAIVLDDDTVLTQAQTAGFIAGATAAAQPNESLTYRVVPGVKDVKPRFTDEQAIAEIQKGNLLLTSQRGTVKILQDINSLHTFTKDKTYDFSKNRPLRVLDDIANTTKRTWEDAFIGQVTNNETGRDLFKATLAEYLTRLQSTDAIQDFSMDDISVRMGNNKDSVVVNLAVTPTDAMEKLYMEVSAR